MNNKWTATDIPELKDKVAIVTGANSGIGFETAKELARHGAQTVLACRSVDKAQAALAKIQAELPNAHAEVILLDLASLDSIHQFVGTFKAKYDQLDLLVNNAGIMMVPYGTTEDGFERQFGTNHLGHFALTGLLLDLLLAVSEGRVVNVSSTAHRMGTIDFENLMFTNGADYSPSRAYARSKLANLLFTYELQRKFEAIGKETLAVAAHPGWTETNLQQHAGSMRFLNRFFAQQPPTGALPTLYAATAADVEGGDYYGPGGFMEMQGYPKKVKSIDASHDAVTAEKLWQISEELTAVSFNWNQPSAIATHM